MASRWLTIAALLLAAGCKSDRPARAPIESKVAVVARRTLGGFLPIELDGAVGARREEAGNAMARYPLGGGRALDIILSASASDLRLIRLLEARIHLAPGERRTEDGMAYRDLSLGRHRALRASDVRGEQTVLGQPVGATERVSSLQVTVADRVTVLVTVYGAADADEAIEYARRLDLDAIEAFARTLPAVDAATRDPG